METETEISTMLAEIYLIFYQKEGTGLKFLVNNKNLLNHQDFQSKKLPNSPVTEYLPTLFLKCSKPQKQTKEEEIKNVETQVQKKLSQVQKEFGFSDLFNTSERFTIKITNPPDLSKQIGIFFIIIPLPSTEIKLPVNLHFYSTSLLNLDVFHTDQDSKITFASIACNNLSDRKLLEKLLTNHYHLLVKLNKDNFLIAVPDDED
jgi:hypothetical protein